MEDYHVAAFIDVRQGESRRGLRRGSSSQSTVALSHNFRSRFHPLLCRSAALPFYTAPRLRRFLSFSPTSILGHSLSYSSSRPSLTPSMPSIDPTSSSCFPSAFRLFVAATDDSFHLPVSLSASIYSITRMLSTQTSYSSHPTLFINVYIRFLAFKLSNFDDSTRFAFRFSRLRREYLARMTLEFVRSII